MTPPPDPDFFKKRGGGDEPYVRVSVFHFLKLCIRVQVLTRIPNNTHASERIHTKIAKSEEKTKVFCLMSFPLVFIFPFLLKSPSLRL